MTFIYVVVALVVIIFWLVVVVLAAVGRSFGVTKLYIRILLFIFEVLQIAAHLFFPSFVL